MRVSRAARRLLGEPALLAEECGDSSSKKRFDAQYAAAEKALDEERARERAEWDAQAVEMPSAELCATKRGGRAPKSARPALDTKPKRSGKTAVAKKNAAAAKRASARRR